MPRRQGDKYEAQAILFEDLKNQAADNDFHIYRLDAEGTVQDRCNPKEEDGGSSE